MSACRKKYERNSMGALYGKYFVLYINVKRICILFAMKQKYKQINVVKMRLILRKFYW